MPRMSLTKYRWAVVGMLWCICFFNYADRQAIFSVFPVLKTEMHLSDLQLGVIGSAFMWVYAASAPLAGLVADRFSRKAFLLGGLVLWGAVALFIAFCHVHLSPRVVRVVVVVWG